MAQYTAILCSYRKTISSGRRAHHSELVRCKSTISVTCVAIVRSPARRTTSPELVKYSTSPSSCLWTKIKDTFLLRISATTVNRTLWTVNKVPIGANSLPKILRITSPAISIQGCYRRLQLCLPNDNCVKAVLKYAPSYVLCCAIS
jgi:hypothetical protein